MNRDLITIRPLEERESKVHLDDVISPTAWAMEHTGLHNGIEIEDEYFDLARAIRKAKNDGRPIIWFIAGHVVKHGLSRFIIDLMANGYATHIACNGAVPIHETELVVSGHTSEDVGRYIKHGEFGHWDVPAFINDAVAAAYTGGETIGEMIGDWLLPGKRARKYSILANGVAMNIPVTVHVLVGGDIIHQHANCPHELFAASYNDFLVFCASIEGLEGGVFINIGSQVTGTEVFLKALSMARNRAHNHGHPLIHNITTAMADFVKLPANWRDGEADESDPAYYYRPWKSILLRTVADGGQSHYLSGPHVKTLPKLWSTIVSLVGE